MSVDLWWEGFGPPQDPVVLLIAGMSQSGIWWEEGFCASLAARGRYVVRYDHRDTGLSTTWPVGEPDYSSDELSRDALRVLDLVGAPAAHLVGLSMGGGIAQDLAVTAPERVLSLTLVSTSPATGRDGLPDPTPEFMAAVSELAPEPDWSDRAAVVDHVLAGVRIGVGRGSWDEARMRRLVELDVDRARDVRAMLQNHEHMADGTGLPAGIETIGVPTLVLHGTADPLFPGHGEVLRDRIPGARLVPLPGMGHLQPPPELWDLVVDEIADHTTR